MSQELLDGQELILRPTNDPYVTEESARHAMKLRKLTEDEYDVIPHGEGFAIARKDGARSNPLPETPVETKLAPPEEKYFRVRFHQKSHSQQIEDVLLGCNGETLVIKRGEVVTVPKRFLEVADNTRYPIYRQEPGKSRKVSGYIQVYPYDILSEGTAEEFNKTREIGTKKTQEYLDKLEMIGG